MSTLISKLMGRIRQRQIESIRSATDEYRELLVEAATEENSVDLDYAEQIRERMGKSLEDFASDIETTRVRLVAAQKIKGEAKALADYAAAQANLDRLNAEATEYRNKQSAKIQQAWDEVKRLEMLTSEIADARHTLRDTVLDRSLAEREKDNNAKRRELRESQDFLAEAIRETNAMIGANERQVARAKKQIDHSRSDNERELHTERMKGYLGGRTRLDGQLRQQQSQLAAIEAELRLVQAESDEIERLRLIP